jgi:hypothetical protein
VEPNTVTLAPSDGARTLFSSNPQVLKLKKGQAKLICDRTDTTKPVSAEIITADANYKPFSFRWVEYQGQIPSPTIAVINSEIQAFMNSLNGAVLAFNSEKCPDGWEPYKEAYGRFLRGIDPTGSKNIDPGGRRKAGTTQEDAFRRHAHDTRLGYSQGTAGPNYAMPYMSPTATPEKLPFSFEGNDETRPKNVAVLYCLKQ